MMIAPLGVSIRATTVPVTPGTLTLPSAGSDLSCSKQLHVGDAGPAPRRPPASSPRSIFSIRSHSRRPGAAVGQRVAHLVLRRKARAPDTSATPGSPTCSSGAKAAQ